ncbi:MAG: lyase family protein, partial [Candidatus Heimdallarchaeota archaeon]|nr:lyase family protein [Candidatus Heimdallarchaeota archaeon]
ENKFALIAAKDSFASVSASLRSLAIVLLKIANDIRWLASGPRCGLGELILPENEPGSSIMPGKINPTQNEMLIQVVAQVLGNDQAISLGAQWGVLQLNLMKPMIISNLLESIEILSNGIISFKINALENLQVNHTRINQLVEQSLMLATALTPVKEIGYDKAAQIAKQAYKEGKTIKEVLLQENIMSEEKIDEILDLSKMV